MAHGCTVHRACARAELLLAPLRTLPVLAMLLSGCASGGLLRPFADSAASPANGSPLIVRGSDPSEPSPDEQATEAGSAKSEQAPKERKPYPPYTLCESLRAYWIRLHSHPCCSCKQNGKKADTGGHEDKKNGEDKKATKDAPSGARAQGTIDSQQYDSIRALYTGPYSLSPLAESDKSAFATLFPDGGIGSREVSADEKNGDSKKPDKKDKANGNGDDKKDEEDKDKDKDKDKEEDENKFKLLPDGWNFHGQTTLIPQFDAPFPAKYSGPNSLSTEAQREGTLSTDLFLGTPLWRGAEFHADLLMWQGFGIGNSFGLEAFPNSDAFKAGTADPRFMFYHFFVRQTFGLGGEQEEVPDGPLNLPGSRDVSRLTITVGRVLATDQFDNNTYNHDPHTQFMSWASTMLSWDMPSDTVGPTTGITIELNEPCWAVRYGWFQLPSHPNGYTSDDRIFNYPVEPGEITSDGEFWKEFGMILELERRWRIEDHPGAIRLQAWTDYGYLASFRVATRLLLASPPPLNTPQGAEVTIPAAAFGFHDKYGFGVNWEQEIAKNVGIFGRVGWQDGQTAAAAFTDVNWNVQLGVSVKGAAWCRAGDTYGFCFNVDGASDAQIDFLKAGGTGILNGDGNLSYAPEKSLETYYDFAVAKNTHLAFDYQFFADPAFNRDRGPVNVFGARLHWEF
jgi:high affinity Mn2+ porin